MSQVTIQINGMSILGVVLDGGSRVNVISEDTTRELGLTWEPILFNIRMVDNRIVIPKGIIRNVRMQIKKQAGRKL